MANARDFPGSSGNIISRVDPTGILTNAAWTCGAWINPDVFGGSGRVVIKVGQLGSGLDRGLAFYVAANGRVNARLSSTAFAQGTTVLTTDGGWYRVGATKAGAGNVALRVHLDGTEEATNLFAGAPTEITTGDAIALGEIAVTGLGVTYFDGQMAWAFWLQGVELSAAAIDGYLQDPESLIAAYGPDGSVVADALKMLWPCQCENDPTEVDLSGAGNDGTIGELAAFTTSGPTLDEELNPCSSPAPHTPVRSNVRRIPTRGRPVVSL